MYWLIRLALYGRGLLLWGIWLLYLLSPIDLFPDFLPYLGRLDDILAAVAVWWTIRQLNQLSHRYAGGFAEGAAGARSARSDGQQTYAETTSTPWDPWKVLHLTPGATMTEIDTAYKHLLMQYHPDRVAHLGEELQQLAHRKTLDIQKAYAQVRPKKARQQK